jgi:peptide/nickel transport system ATP-binding protein
MHVHSAPNTHPALRNPLPGGGPAEGGGGGFSAPLLAVSDLRTHFRTPDGVARAVDGVSFAVRAGETFALVGESGCGKSVTALSILRLVPEPGGFHAGGSITFEGRDLATAPRSTIRAVRGNRIAMIFQEPMTALNPVFTIGDQITEALRSHRRVSRAEARETAIDELARVGIPDAARCFADYPHQLSGGMRQRVMIAMALVCRPAMLIADEPTTALDVTIQDQILELIRARQAESGTAVLLITHDMAVVSENARRVGVMYAGRVVETATRDTLFAQPAHPYTRMLMEALPSRAEAGRPLAVIPGRVPPSTAFPKGCRFHTRCPYAMERCRREAPPAYPVGPDHSAECFLLDTGTPTPPSEIPSPEGCPGVSRGGVGSPAFTQSPLLSLRNLRMHFPIRGGLFRRTIARVRAVDGVGLDIARGETVALVGESGCGKTTVGKCIVRLLDPTEGEILYRGAPVQELTGGRLKPYRRRVQMIFQDPFSSLDPRRTILDTLIEGMETHAVGTSRADRVGRLRALLPRVGLDPDMLQRYPHEFSGGQRQRIGIARALALEPELLVCDEATSSLDISVQAQILNLLRTLQAELGLSYLFISHDISVVRYIAGRMAVMYLGHLVETGPTQAVAGRPLHPYTRALMAAVPRINAAGRKRLVLEGSVPSPAAPPPGCPFHPRCPYAVPTCADALPPLAPMPDAPSRRVACIRASRLD